jgi:hypothetical protein
VLEEQWREEVDISEVHCEQKGAAKKHALIHPVTWQDLSMCTAGLPAANLVAETILVEVETQALMVRTALVVYAFRLWMHPLEALTTAVHQALTLDRLLLGAAK